MGAQRDLKGGDPWEREPLGSQGIPWEGVPDPHMGGEPLGSQGIPWEGTDGSGNPWEPKGSHGRGSRTPYGRGTPHWEPFGDPRTNLEVFCDEVSFQESPKSCKFKISQFSATRLAGTGSQKVAGGVSDHFCLVKTLSSIAKWGKTVLFFFLGGGGGYLRTSRRTSESS